MTLQYKHHCVPCKRCLKMDSPYLNGTSLQRYPCLDLSAIFRLAREKIQKVIFFFLLSTAETLL